MNPITEAILQEHAAYIDMALQPEEFDLAMVITNCTFTNSRDLLSTYGGLDKPQLEAFLAEKEAEVLSALRVAIG